MIGELIGGGVGIVGNLVSGIINRGAAKRAATAQAEAAEAARRKIEETTGMVNQGITEAGANAGAGVTNAAGYAGAASASATDRANAQLDPWRTAGQDASGILQNGLQEGGDFNRAPTQEEIGMDPGFAFRLKQGQIALERSAAAKGTGMGGGALKSLARYSQGVASQEYQNAFNRYTTTTQNRYNNLFGVSQQGQIAATGQGQNLIRSGEFQGNKTFDASMYSGDKTFDASRISGDNTMNSTFAQSDLMTQKANAQASGIVGGANSFTKGFGGAMNSLSSLLTNPALYKKKPPTANANNAYDMYAT